MSSLVTYYGPGLAPTALVVVAQDETGAVSLARPGSDEVIVSCVKLVNAPEAGAAVRVEDAPPAKPAKKGKAE